MEIDKEESIIVRYIPQYIVIETRYKPRQFYEETEEASNVKDESDEVVEVEASDQGIHFEPCDIIECEEELAADELIVETKEVASFDGIDVEIRPQPSPTSPSPQKRRYNFKARKLLDDWFFSHLNSPYPTEDEKEALMARTDMTKLQINYWFINKRKRNKHLLKNADDTADDRYEYSDGGVVQPNEDGTNADGTTVELEVVIQADNFLQRRQRRPVSEENDLPAICDVCGKTFAVRHMLRSHMRRHDPTTWDVCKICNKAFPDGLKRHMRVHSGERPYVCTECGASYKQAHSLTMHKAIHDNSGKYYYCDTCNNGRAYKSKYALRDHLKVHFRIRDDDNSTVQATRSNSKPPKVCTVCGFETYNIRSHMIARHSTLRPFKCEICSETFKFKKDLQTHYAYHSDEMNYQCDECDKRFKTKRKLVIHKRIHTTEKTFKCTECDRSFLVSTYLKKHMLVHTGEKKRHACTECSKDYSGITDLRRHLEREHGIKIQPNPKYANNNMTKKHKII